jgi:hypothetical protein
MRGKAQEYCSERPILTETKPKPRDRRQDSGDRRRQAESHMTEWRWAKTRDLVSGRHIRLDTLVGLGDAADDSGVSSDSAPSPTIRFGIALLRRFWRRGGLSRRLRSRGHGQ